jgi:V/A-type H+/Na+-transporting ATPase subunit C
VNPSVVVGYDYVNARLRAMRSRLLTADDLEALLTAASIEAFIGHLAGTPYREALDQSLVTHAGVMAILRAVHLDQAATLARIASFGDAELGPALAVLLAPYGRHNVILLLRGVAARTAPDAIAVAAVAATPFSSAQLAELARQPSVRRVIDLLAQWHLPSPELAARLVQLAATDLTPHDLVQAFDRAWAEALTAQAAALPDDAAPVRQDLRRQIDLRNLLLALSHQPTELPPPPAWLPGGGLTPDVLEAIRTAPDGVAMDAALAGMTAGASWRPALAGWDGQSPAELQHHWEQALFRWRLGLFGTADPLGPGPVIAFLAAKDAEAQNLRLAAQAVAAGLDLAEVRRHLLLDGRGGASP